MKIIICHGLKGGVGRTAAAVNLSAIAAQEGYSTLLWDLSAQAAASYLYRVDAHPYSADESLLEHPGKLVALIKGSDYANLDLLPAGPVGDDFNRLLFRRGKAKDFLPAFTTALAREYDYLIIDAATTLDELFVILVRLADLIIVPMTEDPLCLQAFQRLSDFFLANALPMHFLMPFLQMIEDDNTLALRRLRTLVPALPATMIPLAPELRQMNARREPLRVFAAESPAAGSFAMLWWEIRTRLQEDV